jgi:TonB family protein
MRFLSATYRLALTATAVALLALAPVRADGPEVTPPKLDLTRWNDQPVYPDGAVAKGELGVTVLAVSVDARSRVTNVAIDKTSGFDDLDQTAVKAVRGLRFDAANDGKKDVAGVMKLAIHFQLTTLPEKPFTDSDVYALKDAGDMMVCKRQDPPLGSYVVPKPLCHTQREWDEIAKQKKDQNIPERPHSPFVGQ